MVKTAEINCPDKVKAFRDISLSWNTIVELVQELASNISDQLIVNVVSFLSFDESTDNGMAHLAVFINACDETSI